MADGVLTGNFNVTTGDVYWSGIVMSPVICRILTQLGIDTKDDSMIGKLIDRKGFTGHKKSSLITTFNAIFDQDPNPYHATDNLTLVLTGTAATRTRPGNNN